MATINKRGDKQWQAKVRKKGYPITSKTFATKSKAEQWSRFVESEMDRSLFTSTTEAENTFFKELLQRYKTEIAPLKKSELEIGYSIKRLERHLGHLIIAAICPSIIAEYRDFRLETVKNDTVRKELSLLSRILKTAQKEWNIYLPKGNPVNAITIPQKGKARDRRLEAGEEALLIKTANQYGGLISTLIQLAIETGARRSEVICLKWKNIDLKKQTAIFYDTKNGDDRTIPLSSKAIAIFKNLPRNINGTVFQIQPQSVSQAFKRVCNIAKIQDLRFHDLRHEATSRFFELGLNIMEVSSITGHKDLAMLKRYTHLRAEDLAKKLR